MPQPGKLMRAVGVHAACLVVFLLAGCSTAGSPGTPSLAPAGAPVLVAPPPATPPAASISGGGVCTSAVTDGGAVGGELVSVDPEPSSAVLIWRPAMDSSGCRTSLRVAGAAAARQLAGDVDRAGPWPRGVFNCPNDDGAGVDVYFEYAGQSEAELVTASLSGCAGLIAPGRAARVATLSVRTDLRAFAPAEWPR